MKLDLSVLQKKCGNFKILILKKNRELEITNFAKSAGNLNHPIFLRKVRRIQITNFPKKCGNLNYQNLQIVREIAINENVAGNLNYPEFCKKKCGKF